MWSMIFPDTAYPGPDTSISRCGHLPILLISHQTLSPFPCLVVDGTGSEEGKKGRNNLKIIDTTRVTADQDAISPISSCIITPSHRTPTLSPKWFWLSHRDPDPPIVFALCLLLLTSGGRVSRPRRRHLSRAGPPGAILQIAWRWCARASWPTSAVLGTSFAHRVAKLGWKIIFQSPTSEKAHARKVKRRKMWCASGIPFSPLLIHTPRPTNF